MHSLFRHSLVAALVAVIMTQSATECAAATITIGNVGTDFDFEWLSAPGFLVTGANIEAGNTEGFYVSEEQHYFSGVDELTGESGDGRTSSSSHVSDGGLYGIDARASASNFGGGVRAGAWVSIPNFLPGQTGVGAGALASNSQSLLLDFRNSPLAPEDIPSQLYAYIFLSGFIASPEYDNFTGVGGRASAFVTVDGPSVHDLAIFDRSTIDLDLSLQHVGIEVGEIGIKPSGGSGYGFVDLVFRVSLDRIPLTEYTEPLTGRTLVAPLAFGETPTDHFALYEWHQALAVLATGFRRENETGLFASFDLTHTLEFSYATLTDGSSLESNGITLYHINEIAAGARGPVVPEPTSLALAGFAGIGMAIGAWRRRRHEKSQAV